MTYTPDIRWQIDWDDDGYSSSYSDVTELVVSATTRWGAEPHLDGRSVAVSTGTGRLILWNPDHRFNPESTSAVLNESTLRGSHKFKVTAGSTLIREGLIELQAIENRIGGTVTYKLKGIHGETITRGDRELTLEGQTLAGVAQSFTAASGIELSVSSEQKTGHVVFKGSWLYFLQDFAKFGGGWILERANGDYVFRRWTDTPNLPLAATLGEEYGYLEHPFRFREEEGHIRNSAECRALVWSQAEESVLAYRTVSTSSGQERQVLLTAESETSRPSQWATFTLSDTNNFSLRMSGGQVETYPGPVGTNSRYVVVIPGTFSGFRTVTVTARGQLERRREQTAKQLTVEKYETQEVFGDRPLLLPPWFPGDYDGIETYTRPWLTNLSQPPLYLQITFPERQDTVGRWENLNSALNPGNAVDVVVRLDDEVITFPMLVLFCELRGGHNTPYYREVIGIKRQSVPTPPLTVSARGVSDVEAFVDVGVPNPSSSTMVYARYREAT